MKSGFLNKLKWFKKKLSWNRKYKAGKWDYMGKEQLRYNAIVKLIESCGIDQVKVLDLGCGYGSLNEYLQNSQYGYSLGIDLSSNAIEKAQKKQYPNAEFQVADIHKFHTDKKFDIVIFNEVLYYLDNQMEIVKKYVEYLNKNGYLIFSFYGIREDLIKELNQTYQLIHTEVVKQSEAVFWGISLYKINS